MGEDDGATDYLPSLLYATPTDTMGGFRPAPWLVPSPADPDTPLIWSSLDRNYIPMNSTKHSFCPGSSIRGVIKSYFLINPGAVRTTTI